jgi:hypothetical protein
MRSSLFSSIVVAGLLSAAAGQVAVAVPTSTPPFRVLAAPQRSSIEPVYYYRGAIIRTATTGIIIATEAAVMGTGTITEACQPP